MKEDYIIRKIILSSTVYSKISTVILLCSIYSYTTTIQYLRSFSTTELRLAARVPANSMSLSVCAAFRCP